ALRESEQRTALIVETALDGVVSMNAGGIITGWNPQAERTFGWTRAEAVGRPLEELVLPSPHRASHAQRLTRFPPTGDAALVNRRVELTALHRDGREFPIELAVSAAPAPGGVTFNAFVRDITERHTAETALRASEQRYRELFENAKDVVFTLDLEGR